MDERKIALASKLMGDREVSIPEVCEAVGVSSSTLYRYLTSNGVPRQKAEEKKNGHHAGGTRSPSGSASRSGSISSEGDPLLSEGDS